MTVADPNKPYYGGANMYGCRGNYFRSVAGNGNEEIMQNSRTMKNWGNDPDEYEQRNGDISFKNQMKHPGWASAVRKGENALGKTIKRN